MEGFATNNSNISYITDFEISFDKLNKYYIDESLANINVTIPSNLGIDTIGTGAFYPDNDLQANKIISVTVLADIKVIDELAFRKCKGMTTLDLSACTNLKEIDSYSISCCYALQYFEIPETVVKLGAGIFYGDTSLKGTAVENNLQYSSEFIIPDSVLYMGDLAFSSTGIERIVTPNNDMFKLYFYTFDNCSSLNNICIQNEGTYFCDYDDDEFSSNPFDGSEIEVFEGFNNSQIHKIVEAHYENANLILHPMPETENNIQMCMLNYVEMLDETTDYNVAENEAQIESIVSDYLNDTSNSRDINQLKREVLVSQYI